MRFFIDRKLVFLEILDRRGLVVAGAIAVAGFLGTYTHIKNFAKEHLSEWVTIPTIDDKSMMANVPDWAVGLGVLLIAALILIFEYAVRLRQSLLPKIRLSFDAARDGLVMTPERETIPLLGGGIKVNSTNCAYLRIRVESLNRAYVRDCVAFLTKIEKQLIPTAPFTEIRLPNPISLTDKPLDAPPRVPRTIDFLKCRDTDNDLMLSAAWPFTLLNAFKDHATYRFTIIVSAGELDHDICVEVDWGGGWNTITARQA